MTWEQFALRFGLDVDTLRNRETGRRDMDAAARSYLRVIWNDPKAVERAYAPTPERVVGGR
jgi:putative transcriptional regulator